MTTPAANFRIFNEACDGLADQTKHASKELAEAAATTLITAKGGPSKLWIYALVSGVTRAATVDNAAL
jgi:hypothetical protein